MNDASSLAVCPTQSGQNGDAGPIGHGDDNNGNLPQPAGTIFPAYYDSSRRCYWKGNSRNGWIEVNETAIRRHLKASGYSGNRGPALVSPVDEQIIKIQEQNDIAYAGPLAGYVQGFLESCGNRILVTSAPKLIQPKEGDFSTIAALIRNLLDDPVRDQQPFLRGWLKIAYESLAAGHHRPGQALAVAGPRNSGKSLLQNLITEILGGRAAKPYRYMSGGTEFNGELFGCEHLMIEDDIGSKDIRARRMFGTKIKEFTVNEVQSCHAKNRQAISLKPFWRLSITLNEEPENLMILPPLDESLEDKLMLLKAKKQAMPMPTNTDAERTTFRNTLSSELPAFIWHLTHWEIPSELKSDRFGITHYHHPQLLEEIQTMAPEHRLFEIIVMHFDSMGLDNNLWEGTAVELENVMLTSSTVGPDARRLLDWTNATGTYLGRLAKNYPDRIELCRTAEKRTWRIKFK